MSNHRMPWIVIAIALLMLTMGMTIWAQEETVPTDAELLQAMDDARFLHSDTGYVTQVMEIYAERPDGVDEASVRLSMKTVEGEEFRLRIDFLSPEDSVGQAFLILEDGTVFLCTPDLAMPLMISTGTGVFGDSTVSTTAGIQFMDEYEIVAREETTLDDTPVLKVELQAISMGTAYPTATVWVDATSYEPIEALLYALSGDPLNRITYDEYAELANEDGSVGDRYVLVQTVENLIQEGYMTRLTISEVSIDPLPEDTFDPALFCREPESD